MTPVGLVMAGCCQVNYILTNIGHRNSIWILNQHPLFWNILTWTQFICFKYNQSFCILKIKVALKLWSWSKAGENNGLIRPPAESVPGLDNREILGSTLNLLWLPRLGASWLGVIGLTACSAYGISQIPERVRLKFRFLIALKFGRGISTAEAHAKL